MIYLFRKISCMIRRTTDKVRNPNHKFMKHNLAMVIDRTPPIGVGVSDHIKVHYQFHTIFMQTHQVFL